MKKVLLSLALMIMVASLTFSQDLQTNFLSFNIPGQVTSTINVEDSTVTVILPSDFGEVNSQVTEFTLSTGATAWIGNEQVSSTINEVDFSNDTVTYTIKNGEKSQDWLVTINKLVGNKLIKSLEVNVFPNPATDNVTLTSNEVINAISILNIVGQTLETINSNTNISNINMSKYNNGIYLILINKEEVIKLYKE